jgi:hypothetical protein
VSETTQVISAKGVMGYSNSIAVCHRGATAFKEPSLRGKGATLT